MRLPRMTIKHWMVVVGTTALALGGISELPDHPPLLLFVAGPIGGMAWVACDGRRRPLAFTRGAAVGAAVEAAGLATLMGIGLVPDHSGQPRALVAELSGAIVFLLSFAFFYINLAATVGLLTDYVFRQRPCGHRVFRDSGPEPPPRE